ncbi:nuclear transport factor 2 family protein [Polaromonas sp. LjRoot131]|uniref:nuclear transport factor 2 family protein n=1 Tax=Polaromonas sp. LjRoot131 TaxID=3342262 RepID=UPI003ECC5F09
MNSSVDRIVESFQNLTLAGVETLGAIYAPDARFKDPFNDVQGLPAVQQIYRHMYETLENPRFVITGRIVQGAQCFLIWEFHFAFKRFQRGRAQCILGGSHLVLDGEGRITMHRDYWDAAEELYEKLPVVGGLMRWMKRRGNA